MVIELIFLGQIHIQIVKIFLGFGEHISLNSDDFLGRCDCLDTRTSSHLLESHIGAGDADTP